MFQLQNLTDSANIKVVAESGAFKVIEHQRDLSVNPASAAGEWFNTQMNVRRRQLLCDLSQSPITVQSGAMQWMLGNVQATTGVKGVGDFFGKALRGAVTNESAIKPEYVGDGLMMCEPTYRFILLEDLAWWNGSMVVDDGMFYACYSSVNHQAVMRQNVSSAVGGQQGLFNLGLSGQGIVALESPCPREELVVVDLHNDALKIDGNMAVAWSGSLNFTTERAGATLIGSAASGEGLVNVYRGTGRILMAPTVNNTFFGFPPIGN